MFALCRQRRCFGYKVCGHFGALLGREGLLKQLFARYGVASSVWSVPTDAMSEWFDDAVMTDWSLYV